MSLPDGGAVLIPTSLAALDAVPAAIFVATIPGGEIIRSNSRAAEMCGGVARVPARMADLFPDTRPDRTGASNSRLAAAVRLGRPDSDIEAVLDAGGSLRAVAVSVRPIADTGGRGPVAIVVCHDIARWTSVAADLTRSEQRLTLALKAGRLGSWEFDFATRRLSASAQCKANHGFGPDEDMQLDTHIFPAMDREHAAQLQSAIDAAVASAGSFEIELPHRFPDGSPHRLLIAGQVIDDERMVGISLDVSQRYEAEETLRAAAEALREADRRKDEFLAVLAHELRTPLAPIITAVKLLELQGPSEPHLIKLRATILRQTLQLSRLVDDLLDLGRIINGKLALHTGVVDVRGLVRQAVEAATPAIERRRHLLDVRVADLPILVDVDAHRIVQVVTNLLNNATKYMPEGGRIEVTAFEESDAAVIRVHDEGVGIAPEMLTRIFDRFVQVGSSSERFEGGLGIGLWVVKAVVDLHGGSVEARSDGLGTGSTFTVRLPTRVASDVPPALAVDTPAFPG